MANDFSSNELATQFEQQLLADIPLARAMQLRLADWNEDRLRLSAPLAPNINDKGCAFGGSLGSLMTLAAWGVVTLKLQAAGLAADVFVADSDVRFLAPLFADLHAEAQLADAGDWDDFIARLRERGRAGLRLAACVRLPDGAVAASSQSRYVAVARG